MRVYVKLDVLCIPGYSCRVYINCICKDLCIFWRKVLKTAISLLSWISLGILFHIWLPLYPNNSPYNTVRGLGYCKILCS